MGWRDAPAEDQQPKWASAPPIEGEVSQMGREPADPRIGQPEELSWMEKLASALDKPGSVVDWWGSGNLRGSELGRVMKGAADPGAAIVQMAANALPGDAGSTVNAAIKGREDEYQSARKAAGSEGFDPLRVAGATGISLLVPGAAAGTTALRGAAVGAGAGALDPVVNGGENFWGDKGRQVALGAAGGAVMTPLMGALARVVSPKASVNPELKMLREADINPTIGQALGGAWNTAEEKAMSWPILGDMIASARRGSVKDFNNAVLNTATGPVGQTVKGAGFDAVGKTGIILGDAYDSAAAKVSHVNFDTPAFNAQLAQLQDMAQGLTGGLADKFDRTVNNVLLRKMSPNGSILGSDLKAVDSELGKIAATYRRSSTASEQEFGDAIRQLQQAFRDGMGAANPEYKAAKDAADQGWRTFRLARNAAAAAKNREGIFTPAQFNSAVQGDAGRAAMGEGRAFMQDAGQAAQNVLGNKYPDSGSIGRLLLNAAAMPAHIASSGATAAALGAGALAYTRPVQNMLVKLLANRPKDAERVANYLRRLAGPGSLAAGELAGGQR